MSPGHPCGIFEWYAGWVGYLVPTVAKVLCVKARRLTTLSAYNTTVTVYRHTCQLPHIWDIFGLKSRFATLISLHTFLQTFHCPLIFEGMPTTIIMIFATHFHSWRLKSCEIWEKMWVKLRPENLRWGNWWLGEIWEWPGASFEIFCSMMNVKSGPFSHSEAWFCMGQLLEPHSEWITVGRSGITIKIFEKKSSRGEFSSYLPASAIFDVGHVIQSCDSNGRRLNSAEKVVCTCILGGQLHMDAENCIHKWLCCFLSPWL